MSDKKWPACRCCETGVLLPLSDYGPQGADVLYKLWVCHNPACGFYLRIQKGQVSGAYVPRAASRQTYDRRRS